MHIFLQCSFLTQPSSRTDWAEEEDESAVSLPAPQITKNKDGTETIVTWFLGEDGKKVKTTRKIRKTVHQIHVNPAIAERRQWAKFGMEKGKPAGPQRETTSVAENIIFRPSANYKATQREDEGKMDEQKAKLKDKKIKCRICSGEHFTSRCPFKETMAPEGEAGAGMGDDLTGVAADAPAAGGLGTGGSSYVPPFLRKGAAGGGERMGGKYERDDLATLRVTNVSESAEEDDLRDLFGRFGRVTRVFLAKDRETGRAKGFAFISFVERSDAAKACAKLDGCKCSNAIDEVERLLTFRSSWPSPSDFKGRVRQEGHIVDSQNDNALQ